MGHTTSLAAGMAQVMELHAAAAVRLHSLENELGLPNTALLTLGQGDRQLGQALSMAPGSPHSYSSLSSPSFGGHSMSNSSASSEEAVSPGGGGVCAWQQLQGVMTTAKHLQDHLHHATVALDDMLTCGNTWPEYGNGPEYEDGSEDG
jgi:hypothetical protein